MTLWFVRPDRLHNRLGRAEVPQIRAVREPTDADLEITRQCKQFLIGRDMVETQLKMGWREALETLVAHRISVVFDAESEGAALIIHGKETLCAQKAYHMIAATGNDAWYIRHLVQLT